MSARTDRIWGSRFDAWLAAGLLLASATLWALAQSQRPLPPWPPTLSGLAFSAFQAGQDPVAGSFPDEDELAADLQRISAITRELRLYSLDGTLARVPALAAEQGIAVTAGVALVADPRIDAGRIARLRSVVRESRNVSRAIIGNESLLHGVLDEQRLARILDAARAALPVPVSTAEPWHVWLRHRALAEHVDFITVHLLPYWEGVHVDRAVEFIDRRMAELRAAFPGKPIVIGEAGWPSRGRTRGDARATPQAQARFLSRFLRHAERTGDEYFLLEAFDQPWKRRDEGDVGAHWGILDLWRVPKAALEAGSRAGSGWALPATGGGILSLALFALLRLDGARVRAAGRVQLAAAAWLVGNGCVWLAHSLLDPYWTLGSALVGLLVLMAAVGAGVVLLAEVHEWAEARWAHPPAPSAPGSGTRGTELPPVSVHLAICNEPPELVLDTLQALAALAYPSLEVLVVDNNTCDPACWRPVQAACARLGPAFRFFHVKRLGGFKAGALNHALARTSPAARVIAVIDADYQVSPGWLRRCVPLFSQPGVNLVQAPQDYRDGHRSPFKALCHAEYRGFFHIGMVTRDARNAIIQHGTMTLVRRAALEAAGGWGEWTITEDAELGLRLLSRGGRARYVATSQGRGLTPDNFLDYKRQRLRWALGAVQILRGHAGLLTGLRASAGAGRLSRAQRYHFVAGWLPWLADGASVLCSLGAVGWSALMLAAPMRFDPPLAAVSCVPVVLFALRLAKHLHLYHARVRAGLRDTLAAALAGWALMPTAGVAVLMGLIGLRRDFLPTPKLASRHCLRGALAAAGVEGATGAGLLAMAALLSQPAFGPGPDLDLWRLALVVMSVPFVSALGVSLLSALPAPHRMHRAAVQPARAWASRTGDGD